MQIIFNADDFGGSTDINNAIIHAHRQGVLTSASLMVGGAAVEHAVALARENPRLAVGLHLALVADKPILAPAQIPHLVTRDGNFSPSPTRAGWNYFFQRAARQELQAELRAQFERFAATGLPLDHVNGHLHLHLHPVILELVLPLANEFGARGLRLPRDELVFALRYDARDAAVKTSWALALGLLCRWARTRVAASNLATTARVYGLLQSGQMRADYVVQLLERMQVPSAELYFHPTFGARRDAWGANPDDLATLLDPRVRQVITKRNFRLATFSTLL